jgi:hypothetical protein
MKTYSFQDTNAAITGPGGSFQLGSGTGVADEGITLEPTESLNTMTIGADGRGMHNLHADKSGKITVRLLKTSPTNQLLMAMLEFQRTSAAYHGQNTISIVHTSLGEVATCEEVAFNKVPTITYAKDGGYNEWTFDAVRMTIAPGK